MALKLRELFDTLLRRKSKTITMSESDDLQYTEYTDDDIREIYGNNFDFTRNEVQSNTFDSEFDEAYTVDSKRVNWAKDNYVIDDDNNRERYNKESHNEDNKIEVKEKEKRVCEMYKTKSGIRVSWNAKCKRTGGSIDSKCRCSNCRTVFLIQNSLQQTNEQRFQPAESITQINKLEEKIDYLQNKVKTLETSKRPHLQVDNKETQYSRVTIQTRKFSKLTIQETQTSTGEFGKVLPDLAAPSIHPTWNYRSRKEMINDMKHLNQTTKEFDKRMRNNFKATLAERCISNKIIKKGMPRRLLQEEKPMNISSKKVTALTMSPVYEINIVGDKTKDDNMQTYESNTTATLAELIHSELIPSVKMNCLAKNKTKGNFSSQPCFNNYKNNKVEILNGEKSKAKNINMDNYKVDVNKKHFLEFFSKNFSKSKEIREDVDMKKIHPNNGQIEEKFTNHSVNNNRNELPRQSIKKLSNIQNMKELIIDKEADQRQANNARQRLSHNNEGIIGTEDNKENKKKFLDQINIVMDELKSVPKRKDINEHTLDLEEDEVAKDKIISDAANLFMEEIPRSSKNKRNISRQTNRKEITSSNTTLQDFEQKENVLDQIRTILTAQLKNPLLPQEHKELPNLQSILSCNTIDSFQISSNLKSTRTSLKSDVDNTIKNIEELNDVDHNKKETLVFHKFDNMSEAPSTSSSRRSNILNIKMHTVESQSTGIKIGSQKGSKIPIRNEFSKKRGFFSILPRKSRSRPTSSGIMETGDLRRSQPSLKSGIPMNANVEKFLHLLEKLSGDKAIEKNLKLIDSLKKIDECNEKLEWLSNKI